MSRVSRLTLAIEAGELSLPDTGRIAVFGPTADADLSALPVARSHVICGFRPDYDHFAARGFDCAVAPQGRYDAAIVMTARARALTQARIAQACALSNGPVIVDGAKTDGIESILRACRARADVSGPINKSHGKLFWFPASGAFEDWRAGDPQKIEDGFVTAPGVFSADAVDPASRMLGDALPARLGRVVADLGGGWGYLASRALGHEGIERLHLVEADHTALDCARLNLADPRVTLHWADATTWRAPEPVDCVLMNPPFHTGRAADPGLGRAFLRAAAAMLTPRGHVFLVANRHLPYEAEMAALFAQTTEFGGDSRFKLLMAERPLRRRP